MTNTITRIKLDSRESFLDFLENHASKDLRFRRYNVIRDPHTSKFISFTIELLYATSEELNVLIKDYNAEIIGELA